MISAMNNWIYQMRFEPRTLRKFSQAAQISLQRVPTNTAFVAIFISNGSQFPTLTASYTFIEHSTACRFETSSDTWSQFSKILGLQTPVIVISLVCSGRRANLGSFWVFIHFLSLKQCLRPLSHCAPNSNHKLQNGLAERYLSCSKSLDIKKVRTKSLRELETRSWSTKYKSTFVELEKLKYFQDH